MTERQSKRSRRTWREGEWGERVDRDGELRDKRREKEEKERKVEVQRKGRTRKSGSETVVLIKEKDVWLLFRSHRGNAQLLIWLLCSSGMLASL